MRRVVAWPIFTLHIRSFRYEDLYGLTIIRIVVGTTTLLKYTFFYPSINAK